MGKMTIVSRSDWPFVNREEAGRLLGAELIELRGLKAVVYNISRSGLVIAREIARTIDAELQNWPSAL